MRHRLLSPLLCLVLLLTQHLGALHLLSHGQQPAALGQALPAQASDNLGRTLDTANATASPDAGDALCQICLALATLAAVALPALCGWLLQRTRAAAAPPATTPAAVRHNAAPYRARGPPLPALS